MSRKTTTYFVFLDSSNSSRSSHFTFRYLKWLCFTHKNPPVLIVLITKLKRGDPFAPVNKIHPPPSNKKVTEITHASVALSNKPFTFINDGKGQAVYTHDELIKARERRNSTKTI